MSSTNMAQGSVRITRLRNGDTLVSSLYNDKPLFQAVLDGGAVTPDWTVAANQPIIRPDIYSSYGNSVTLKDFNWYYNNYGTFAMPIDFGPIDATTGWRTEDSATPRFMVYDGNDSTIKKGTLKIIANLASKTNDDNDKLEFRGNVESAGNNQMVTASTDIFIQPMGASAYRGLITASATMFTDTVTQITLTPSLVSGAGIVGSYTVEWYKDTDKVTTGIDATTQALTVGRDDVDSSQVYIAKFLINSAVVSSYGVTLTDTTDEVHVAFNTTGGGTIASTTDQVVVTAKLVDRDGTELTPAGIQWTMDIRDHATWESVLPTGPISGNTITVTSKHTDRNEQQNDVEVIAEAEW